MNNIKILVSVHKPDPYIRKDDIYTPIHAGKFFSNIDIGYKGDNTGDNISNKNKSYCELTVLYWAWKNLTNIDYIGLAHYRRYLKLSPNSILKILKNNDIILAQPAIHPYSIAKEFESLVSQEDLYILINTILKKYPDYKDSMIQYLYKSNHWIPCNMFICKWELFNQYCSFLFTILSEVEQQVRPYGYTRLNRNLGYMGELLLGIFCIHNKLKIHFAQMEISGNKNQDNTFRNKLTALRNDLSFKIANASFHKQTKIPIYQSIITGLQQDNININDLLENNN